MEGGAATEEGEADPLNRPRCRAAALQAFGSGAGAARGGLVRVRSRYLGRVEPSHCRVSEETLRAGRALAIFLRPSWKAVEPSPERQFFQHAYRFRCLFPFSGGLVVVPPAVQAFRRTGCTITPNRLHNCKRFHAVCAWPASIVDLVN